MSTTDARRESSVAAWINPMAVLPAQAFAAWHALGTAPIAISIETLRFVGRRLSADADHLAKLAACSDVGAAMSAQSSFLKETVEDYRREATVIGSTWRDAIATTASAADNR